VAFCGRSRSLDRDEIDPLIDAVAIRDWRDWRIAMLTRTPSVASRGAPETFVGGRNVSNL
jgi:hypothetical protein